MIEFAIYESALDRARNCLALGDNLDAVMADLLTDRGAEPNGLIAALIAERGVADFAASLAVALGLAENLVGQAVRAALGALKREPRLTGAEAVTLLWREAGVKRVFAYPGTSELAVCEAVARTPGLELLNGRGDRESVFMAAGANLLGGPRATAIIHAARGLTNATGAIADIRRNEVSAFVLVGLPSTGSAPFLPPHGEWDLMPRIGTFAKDWWEATEIPPNEHDVNVAADTFVARLRRGLMTAVVEPAGPVLVGIPQDVLERRWLPLAALREPQALPPAQLCVPDRSLERLTGYVTGYKRPLILIDDYLLKQPGAVGALRDLARQIGAPVLQVRYVRGAMLFERLSVHEIASFEGWYQLEDEYHRKLMNAADLLITLEDRNMYPRVVGVLPPCAKLALTSNAAATVKNGYLELGDLLVEAPVVGTIRALVTLLRERATAIPWAPVRPPAPPDEPRQPWEISRKYFCESFSAVLAQLSQPVVVDDSQMFGGLIASWYDLLPPRVRVFGDHGGFVGAGTAYATGLALLEPHVTVVCTVGDQGFTNGLQAVVAAGEQRAPVTFVVCNNGESVSLRKQSLSSASGAIDSGLVSILRNADNLDYTRLAADLGLRTQTMTWPVTADERVLVAAADYLRITMTTAVSERRPWLLELKMQGLGPAWTGIWAITGNEPV